MQDQCLIAEFADREKARTAVQVLHRNRVKQDHISIVTSVSDGELQELGRLREGESEGDSAKGAAVGAVLGGGLALPLAAPTLIGPFLVAGPLVGMGLGAAAGGLLSNAQRWGVDEASAKDLERRVMEGHILLIIQGEDLDLSEVESVLQTVGPEMQNRFAEPEHSASGQ